MLYSRKTSLRIDTIPPELCTRKDIGKIHGITCTNKIFKSRRFKNLRYLPVIYKGNRIFLYNRKEVEAAVYPPPPKNYIPTLQAAQLFGKKYKRSSDCQRFIQFLRRHNIKSKTVPCSHPYLVWHLPSLQALLKQIRKS